MVLPKLLIGRGKYPHPNPAPVPQLYNHGHNPTPHLQADSMRWHWHHKQHILCAYDTHATQISRLRRPMTLISKLSTNTRLYLRLCAQTKYAEIGRKNPGNFLQTRGVGTRFHNDRYVQTTRLDETNQTDGECFRSLCHCRWSRSPAVGSCTWPIVLSRISCELTRALVLWWGCPPAL